MGRVCELVMVVMVIVLSHHLAAASHPFLRDECLVKEKENKFSTFDDNIILHLAALEESQDVRVTAKQGSYEIKPKIENMNLLTWFKLELSLDSENLTCLLNENKIDCAMDNTSNSMGEKKWEVEVVGAVFYIGCPEEMPVFVVKEGEGASIEIPRSGSKEVLILLPTADTSISVSVGGKKKLVCRDEEGSVKLMDSDTSSCRTIKKDTFTRHDSAAQITVTDEGGTGDNSISFSPTNLKGLLYIVQCTKVCRDPGKGITTTPTRITTTPQEGGKGITTTPTSITTTSTTTTSNTTTSNTTTPKKGGTDGLPTEYVVLMVLAGVLLGFIVGFAIARLHSKLKEGKESSHRQPISQPGPVTYENQEGSANTSFTIQTSHDNISQPYGKGTSHDEDNDIYEPYVPGTSHDEANDIYESYVPETSHDEANDIYQPFNELSSP